MLNSRWRWPAIPIAAVSIAGGLFAAGPTDTPGVTFSKDVAPVLRKHCQDRPEEAAPFSLLTYPHYSKLSNDRSPSQSDVGTLVAWADGGAPEGDAQDLPPQLAYVEGWSIPKPDVVYEFPQAFQIRASGAIEYRKVTVPSGFTEDKWMQFAEAQPDDRAHVHHMILYVCEPGSHWLRGEPAGVFFVAPKVADDSADTSALPRDFLVGYAPGQPPEILEPGQGRRGFRYGDPLHHQWHGQRALRQLAKQSGQRGPQQRSELGDQSWDEMMVGFFNPEFPAGRPVEGILRHTVARN